MDKIIQVVTTCNDKERLEKIGMHLVKNRLAACAQLSGPINGEIEEVTEWVCTLKSTAGLYEKVETAIKELHPYDLPEIIAINVEKTLPTYADWVKKETEKPNIEERV
jgi:periplasmic divalent cation tolerance protein